MKPNARGRLSVLPLGGLGEIGKNLTLLEYGEDAFLIDCGIRFPNPVEYPGIDLILPDFGYMREIRDRLRGVVLTHGHEDHIGGLAFLLKEFELPVWGTPYTLALARQRIEEQGVLGRTRLTPIGPASTLELGCFRIGFFYVCHSTAEGVGLAVESPAGLLVHTGDFKFDSSPVDGRRIDEESLRRIGDLGVDLLISDSTNVERPGWTPSESEVGPVFEKLLREAERRVFFTSFASHVHRFQQLLEAADRTGRKVATLGRSMNQNMRLALELGQLKPPPGVWVDWEELKGLDPRRSVVATTGSQGEVHSGLLRLGTGAHSELKVEAGDLLIYSARAIPGNERNVGRLINSFYRQGAEVVTETQERVHVSGHGSREDLRRMLRLLRPRYFIPAHGELRHQVAHRRLAFEEGIPKERVFVLENGQRLEFDGREARVAGGVPCGEVLVDGLSGGAGGDVEPLLRDRRHLNEGGMVVCLLSLSRSSGEILSGPELLTHGAAAPSEQEVLEQARQSVRQALADWQAERSGRAPDWAEARELVTVTLKRFFKRRLGRRPVVLPAVMEV